MVDLFVGLSGGYPGCWQWAMAVVTVMADVLHGFNYFFRFGTAARPDHALCAETRLLTILTRASCDGIILRSWKIHSILLTFSIVKMRKELALYIRVFCNRTDGG